MFLRRENSSEIKTRGQHPSGEFRERVSAAGYILLVEDNRELARAVAEFLAANGYRVKSACSAVEAIAIIDQAVPTLILLDLRLPGEMDGFQLYQELRSRIPNDKIPFIVVSGMYNQDTFILAHELGAKGYFTKPFDVEKLREKVELVFSARIRSRPTDG